MNFDWALWKEDPTYEGFRTFREGDLPKSGFSSVYRYKEEDARAFEAMESFKGFKGTVFSDKLKVDVDDSEAAERTQKTLRELGVSFSRFTTGNRGKHFSIKREAHESHLLPAYDKWLVSQLFPGADTSIYHHVAMYRQPGCVHKKTGQPKKLELWRPGEALPDRFKEFLELQKQKLEASRASSELKSIFTDRYLSELCRPLNKGNRHNTLVKIARQLARLNQNKQFAVEFLKNMVAWGDELIPTEELERMVAWAYSQE